MSLSLPVFLLSAKTPPAALHVSGTNGQIYAANVFFLVEGFLGSTQFFSEF